jgi:hypothetical protein
VKWGALEQEGEKQGIIYSMANNKFNVIATDKSAMQQLEADLQALASKLGATDVGNFEDDGEGMCGAMLGFNLNGQELQFSITNDPEELEFQNDDGAPNIRIVQVDSIFDGNIDCCESLEDLEAALKKL